MIDVPVAVLQEICDPFRDVCWLGLDHPIRPAEVEAAVTRGELLEPLLDNDFETVFMTREEHIRRIAWFIRHGFSHPIHIDVGIPGMTQPLAWIITDGNHRFASRILTKAKTIPAEVSGSLRYAREIGIIAAGVR